MLEYDGGARPLLPAARVKDHAGYDKRNANYGDYHRPVNGDNLEPDENRIDARHENRVQPEIEHPPLKVIL